MPHLQYKTVWISDTHLGSKGCRAEELARFLKVVRCERLYLVGDIVDFWRLRSRPYWPREHNEVLRRVLKLVRRGVQVTVVPGNHDEALRHYVGTEFGGIEVCPRAVHTTHDGRRLLVTHGDQYDLVVKHSRLLAHLGAAAYEWLLVANRWYNRWRVWRGRPYWSLAQHLKLKVKTACLFVSRFQETLEREARERGLDGVVCGHIHQPAHDERGAIAYYNCGDWIENLTAIVEHDGGRIELVCFAALEYAGSDDEPPRGEAWDEEIDAEELHEVLTDWLLVPA